MTYPIKLFTVYGKLRGRKLFYGTTFIPVHPHGIPDGSEGFFVIYDKDELEFSIVSFTPVTKQSDKV
jgi:hypothetical protein